MSSIRFISFSIASIGCLLRSLAFFFFNDTATTEIYTLSLHDALPISLGMRDPRVQVRAEAPSVHPRGRSEEHTSELQSHHDLGCRLLLEKKKKKQKKKKKKERKKRKKKKKRKKGKK